MATSSPSHDHGPDQLSLAQAPPLLGGAAALRSELNTSQQLQSPTLNVTQASVSPEPGSSPRGLARAGSSSSGDSIIEWPIRRSLRKSEGGSIHRTPPRTVDASIVSTSSHLSHTSVIEEAFRSLADPEPSPPGPMLPKPSPSQAQIEPPGWSDGGRGNAREPQLADRLAPAEKHSEAWVVEAHEAAAGVGLKANSVDDSEKEEDLRNIFTQGAADCKFVDPHSIVMRDRDSPQPSSRLGSEDNFSTKPAPSSMAAPSVVAFSLSAESDFDRQSDFGSEGSFDNYSIKPAPSSKGAPSVVSFGAPSVVSFTITGADFQNGGKEDGSTFPGNGSAFVPMQPFSVKERDRSIVMSTQPITTPLKVPATMLPLKSSTPYISPGSAGRKKSPGGVPLTDEEGQEMVKAIHQETEYERTRMTRIKFLGLLGLVLQIVFWGGLYIGMNFKPK